MTTVRCPSCDAAVPADGAWCTLCFAPLGDQGVALSPAPVAHSVVAPVLDPLDPALPLAELLSVAPAPVAPAPVAPASVAPALAPVAPVVAAPAPVAPVVAAPAPGPVAPAVAAPVTTTPTALAEPPAPTWPCTRCDTQVPLEEMACPTCGSAFMGGTGPSVSLKVPGVGDLVTMSTGARFGFMAGGALVFSLLLVLVFLVLGHLV